MTEALMSPSWGEFFAAQLRRGLLRAAVSVFALASVLFWALALVGAAWLVHWRLSSVAIGLFVLWVYFAIPGLIAQLQLIIDVLSFAVTGRTTFYPLHKELVESGELERRRAALPPGTRRFVDQVMPIFLAVSCTTPFIGLAIWSAIVLQRMPETAHVRAPVRRVDIRRAVEFTRQLERSFAAEYAERQLTAAA